MQNFTMFHSQKAINMGPMTASGYDSVLENVTVHVSSIVCNKKLSVW